MATDSRYRSLHEIENLFIPLVDGVRLAARVWLPADAELNPVPAILEYIPYRKRDFMRRRDEPIHRYYAAHGYAAVRVDLRGSGDSDGVLEDEYLAQEQQDAVEVIAWLARQSWCNGRVGMTGISWGGFNSLQVAARRPPELGAIITLCASDDRYADDAHYMGGCLLNENQIWGTVLFAINALPPDPEVVGESWREIWHRRLQADRPFAALWLEHQRRDAYWRRGSVNEDFSRIECPVYAIGGWADGYSNAVPRLLAGLSSPCKGLIGPWAHTFPHDGVPGPAIGYLQEALRWWDRWLKDVDNGIDDEPRLRVWLQDYIAPEPFITDSPGRWIAERDWPSPRIEPCSWYFSSAAGLERAPAPTASLRVASPQTTGLGAGNWCGFGGEGDAPLDQRSDDGRSLVFDSAALEHGFDILGCPVVELALVSDQPVAMVAVRLNDVAPDGASARVSYGLLNLTHRNSHAAPEALEPGKRYSVRVELNAIAHRFAPGHALRVAISTAYWPLAWPPPAPVTLQIDTAGCRLELPMRPSNPADAGLPAFAPPESGEATTTHTPLKPPRLRRSIERDLVDDHVGYHLVNAGGDLDGASRLRIEEIDLELSHHVERHFHIDDRDSLSARSEVVEQLEMRRGDWAVAVRARMLLTADEKYFRLRAWLEADEKDGTSFRRNWDEKIERDLL